MTDRRSFLKGILALSATPLLPSIVLAAPLPTIWGDGIHDDAPGLNAMLAGQPFEVEGHGFTASEGVVRGGTFAIASPIVLSRNNILITECQFIVEDGCPYFIGWKDGDGTGCEISRCHVMTRKWYDGDRETLLWRFPEIG